MKDRNVLKGLFLAVIAVVFGLGALRYNTGTMQRPGPGFFPFMVSMVLFVLGVAMAVRAHFSKDVPMHFTFKNIAIVLGSLAGFAVLSEYVNMILGIAFLVFASTFAGTNYSVRRNLAVTAVLVGIAFVFQKGLGLQLPLF
jgi:tripartite tricarboxylate transporter TctB family protein